MTLGVILTPRRGDLVLYQSCGTGKQSIRQFANWLMHSPPGCADMIQVSFSPVYQKEELIHMDELFFLVRERRLEPAVRGGATSG